MVFKSMKDLRQTQKKNLKNPKGGHFEYGRQGTSTTFELEKMLNSPGKIFKREEIASLIDLYKERSIDVIVTRLRKKIEETPKSPKYLQTIRGEGYVLWIE